MCTRSTSEIWREGQKRANRRRVITWGILCKLALADWHFQPKVRQTRRLGEPRECPCNSVFYWNDETHHPMKPLCFSLWDNVGEFCFAEWQGYINAFLYLRDLLTARFVDKDIVKGFLNKLRWKEMRIAPSWRDGSNCATEKCTREWTMVTSTSIQTRPNPGSPSWILCSDSQQNNAFVNAHPSLSHSQ
jgi:hypothetical protein